MDIDVVQLANMIFGEAASEDADTMVMVGSTALNRLEAGRAKEFGSNLGEVLQKGFYAVSNPNEPYKQAVSGKFPDEDSELRYKHALSTAYALIDGAMPRTKGHFYFTDSEVKKLQKNKKAFDFSKVKSTGKVGKYQTYSY